MLTAQLRAPRHVQHASWPSIKTTGARLTITLDASAHIQGVKSQTRGGEGQFLTGADTVENARNAAGFGDMFKPRRVRAAL